ncbi:hypothetical protein OH809_27660 [Streptomyces sp. NBC_00873]|uniref:hypothetical protein n=1 Tax=unclassified Streptomyces TaxID=2593676 RepID=UPI003863B468|nr:hypothetical protein OH809_27660 [Streptomyces sp. NBC_00873]WTA43938.1 hypothetical protein OH821_16020 [Streptomyces sp. NBC_00842]
MRPLGPVGGHAFGPAEQDAAGGGADPRGRERGRPASPADVLYATRAAGSGRRLNTARRTTPVADRSAVVTGTVGRSGGAGAGAAPLPGAAR